MSNVETGNIDGIASWGVEITTWRFVEEVPV
jgi:hypothetical protein